MCRHWLLELFGVDEHWVKEDVYYAAVDFVFSCYGKLGEWPAVLDLPGGFVYCLREPRIIPAASSWVGVANMAM